jgi:hypothetical protein
VTGMSLPEAIGTAAGLSRHWGLAPGLYCLEIVVASPIASGSE